jgi:hypothetical protein
VTSQGPRQGLYHWAITPDDFVSFDGVGCQSSNTWQLSSPLMMLYVQLAIFQELQRSIQLAALLFSRLKKSNKHYDQMASLKPKCSMWWWKPAAIFWVNFLSGNIDDRSPRKPKKHTYPMKLWGGLQNNLHLRHRLPTQKVHKKITQQLPTLETYIASCKRCHKELIPDFSMHQECLQRSKKVSLHVWRVKLSLKISWLILVC